MAEQQVSSPSVDGRGVVKFNSAAAPDLGPAVAPTLTSSLIRKWTQGVMGLAAALPAASTGLDGPGMKTSPPPLCPEFGARE